MKVIIEDEFYPKTNFIYELVILIKEVT